MRVLICHGRGSGPDSVKCKEIAKLALVFTKDVDVIDFRPDGDPEARLKRLLAHMPGDEPTVLVGSSMGGWVAMAASLEKPVLGLFLMAPASGTLPEGTVYRDVLPRASRTCVLHGLHDDVVPFMNSVRLVEALLGARREPGGLKPTVSLSLVDDGHRLHGSLDIIRPAFTKFMHDCAADLAASNGVFF